MTLDRTVNQAIWNYPLLYRSSSYWASRMKVLDHLFFTNGNGYDWVGGELVDDCEDTRRERFRKFPPGYFAPGFVVRTMKGLTEGAGGIRPLSNEFSKHSPFEALYPVCEYSRAYALPKAIKRDWHEGIKEWLAVTRGYYAHEFRPKKADSNPASHYRTEEFRRRQLAWIRKIERRLEKVRIIRPDRTIRVPS